MMIRVTETRPDSAMLSVTGTTYGTLTIERAEAPTIALALLLHTIETLTPAQRTKLRNHLKEV